mgnify:FL=1
MTTTLGPIALQQPTASAVPAPLKRCAVIGTAQSWNQCPWEDQGLEVWSLNDAYLRGIPRMTRWYDLHPTHQWVTQSAAQARISSGALGRHAMPAGGYLRPDTHAQWLATRPFPVYVLQPRPDWPTSRAFPFAEILQAFAPLWPWRRARTGQILAGTDYETSTPAWMLLHALLEGYQEIHVYGIHLATEWEYIEQRPNFEWLLGLAAGRGVKIVLPQMAPLCRGPFRYGLELKADVPLKELTQQAEQIKAEGALLQQRHAALSRWQIGARGNARARLQRLDWELTDTRRGIDRLKALAAL